MSAAEFGEWFQMWQWQPWEAIPSPPADEKEIDPLDWVTLEQNRRG